MTPEESCDLCKHGHGAFRSCVVLSVFTGSSYLDGGCCMNCYFKLPRKRKCSLCKLGSSQDILRSNNVPC